ncbi:hypothetical protein [Kitasatospora phosalacinea]|uniref:Uncharacterized protein n=1 Tax=Kitasatospora phosalacinea TaxID=2065 RepID=A0A9W6UQX2_9ACTN|nr:hypothetical protein [Kitasatospora phosalacinea]GLW57659.1 hypothetical protein Kpho01_56700 [Kitasatospora phosalacinea]
MTYEISFWRVPEGSTLEDVQAERNAAYDAWVAGTGGDDCYPHGLTERHRADWARLLRRITEEIGPGEAEEFPYGLDFWRIGPDGAFQLQYTGDTASIEIPHRHPGEAALPITDAAYRAARMVEEELGLLGHDHEVDQPVRTGDPRRAAARLGGVAAWAQRTLG